MTSVVDNLGENTLQNRLQNIGVGAVAWDLATAFLSLEGLRLLDGALETTQSVRLLFGEDADRLERTKILQLMRNRSDAALRDARAVDPTLEGLRGFARLLSEGRVQARVYRKNPINTDAKGAFHAKVYIAHHSQGDPHRAIAGSGNLSKNGLTRNIELGLKATDDQAWQLAQWFEDRWREAVEDDVTEELHRELLRHLDLYPPRALFLRALLEWGEWVQGREPETPGEMLDRLDPHQRDGYNRAIKVLKREDGVMVCDGVGLGKSFIALAIMERFLRERKQVLLVAPKAILDSSWQRYIEQFLEDYRGDFRLLSDRPITDFQKYPARADGKKEDEILQRMERRNAVEERERFLKQMQALGRNAHLIVIDESHNLRTPSAERYLNMLAVLAAGDHGPKKVVLLTATPLNTKHVDLTAQFALAKSGPDARVGGKALAELRPLATRLDGEMRRDPDRQPTLDEDIPDHRPLIDALKQLAIQRSRATCKAICQREGKRLHFPERKPIETVAYRMSAPYARLVDEVEREFLKLAKFLADYREEVQRAAKEKKGRIDRRRVKLPDQGMRLSAYLIDRYRRPDERSDSLREAQVESFLATLVFKNVMKQMESSPVAFQSILQSLGAGLAARLLTAFPSDAKAQETVERHKAWINRRVRTFGEEFALDDDIEEDDAAPMGEELEDVLLEVALADRVERALRSATVRKSLVEFGPETHDVVTWRKHLEGDLTILETLADLTHAARASGDDLKLERIAEKVRNLRAEGNKVLIFTQSVRTAEYLEDNLPRFLNKERAERIDANVGGERRQRLLHRFSPKYNPPPRGQAALPGTDELNILIATDVLSEGVNLQQAGAIVNYDLHWNPVRLIQRIGRVDRRLAADDPGHAFAIVNVLPPKELERILKLEATVAGRVGMISSVLGIDQAFFKSTDPQGTLKEFDGMVDGHIEPEDNLLMGYNALREPTDEEAILARRVPDGAFGVWKGCGATGGFAMFRLVLSEGAPEADQNAFGRLVGQPVVALIRRGQPVETDVVRALTWLDGTPSGQSSADPSDNATLKRLVRDLREEAEESLPNLPQWIKLELVVWMELRS